MKKRSGHNDKRRKRVALFRYLKADKTSTYVDMVQKKKWWIVFTFYTRFESLHSSQTFG